MAKKLQKRTSEPKGGATAKREKMASEPKGLVTAQDFFSGLIAALKLETDAQSSPQFRADRRLNQAIEAAYVEFTKQLKKKSLLPLFHIKLDPTYGDSETINAGLASASGRNLIRFFNPTYAGFDLKLSTEQAKGYLAHQREGDQPYRLAAKRMLEHYL